MNKHTQNLEEQIKALSIENERLEREYDELYDRMDEEIDELEDLLFKAGEYFLLSIWIGFALLILNIIQFIK